MPVIILNFTSFHSAFLSRPFLQEKVSFKSGRNCGFFNRNAVNDTEIIRRSCERKSTKNSGLDSKTVYLTNRRKSGCKTELFSQIFCRFLRMSFFCACPGISPRRRLAHIVARSYPIRTVIQLSGRLFVHLLINWEFFCYLNEVNFVNFPQRQKEPVHSTSNQREKISRYIFDETMYRL